MEIQGFGWLLELTVEVERSRAVGVDLLYHHVKLLRRQFVVQLVKNVTKYSGCYVAVAFFVVQSECFA